MERKNYRIEKDLDKYYFIKICKESTTMSQACSILKLHFNTFKKIAIKLNCYFPNQGGKGIQKSREKKISTEQILSGNYPEFQTLKLKNRIIEEGIKERLCEVCHNTTWEGKPIPLELDHIDGNRFNHLLDNLRLVCPNCHAQSPHYRGANMSKNDKL